MTKKKTPKPIVPPVCECGRTGVFSATSSHLYNGVDYGPMWECQHCDAYCGCHRGTRRPLGRLANKDLRKAKMAAHAAFDPLWRRVQHRDGLNPNHARARGYIWLAEQMGIESKDCHIGHFTTEQCTRVVAICHSVGKTAAP